MSEVASGDGNSVYKLWVKDVANSSRSLDRGGVPSDVVSMVQFLSGNFWIGVSYSGRT